MPPPRERAAVYDSPHHSFLVLMEHEQQTPAAAGAGAGAATAAPAVSQAPVVAPPAAARGAGDAAAALPPRAFSPWRVMERMRTTNAVLVLSLNLGVDPPDVVKPNPCARMECWVNPADYPKPAQAINDICRGLQSQFERWQRRARYKLASDPTVSELKRVCLGLRRVAKEERMLFYYNGHGVPKPTHNGEVWVFSRDYTQYIPLSLHDVQGWMGMPALYVFDCNCGGLVVSEFLRTAAIRDENAGGGGGGGGDGTDTGGGGLGQGHPDAAGGGGPAASGAGGAAAGAAGLHRGGGGVGAPGPADADADADGGEPRRLLQRDSIILAACGAEELLPMHPSLPADMFTCCLTTPIKMALRWYLPRSTFKNVTEEMLDKIPGQLADRATPLGALNWIFTAVTDTIAWNVLPRALFKRLFRQDLLLASLMRNFLLADRVMRSHGCTPVSHPRLPETHQHSLWQSFDLTLDTCIVQLPEVARQAEAAQAEAAHIGFMNAASDAWDDLVREHQLRERPEEGVWDYGREPPRDRASVPVPPGFGHPAQSWSSSSNFASPGNALDTRDMNGHGDVLAEERASPDIAGFGGYEAATPASDGQARATAVGGDGVGRGASNALVVMPNAWTIAQVESSDEEIERKRLLWKAKYDEALEAEALVKKRKSACSGKEFELALFFEKHMKSFSSWLDLKSASRGLSERLPIMLQILLSEKYRVKALHLLARYLQTGPDAVDLALAIGYFPYVEKLLGSRRVPALKKELVFIWGKILALDPSTANDICKANGEEYFLDFLKMPDRQLAGLEAKPVHLVMALFVLSSLPRVHPDVAERCRASGLVKACQRRMGHSNALVRRWSCLCLTELVRRSEEARRSVLYSEELVSTLFQLSRTDRAPDVRSAAIALLTFLILRILPLVKISAQPMPRSVDERGTSSGQVGREIDLLSSSAPQPVHGRLSSPRTPASFTEANSTADGSGGGGTSGYELSNGSSLPRSVPDSADSGSNQNSFPGGGISCFSGSDNRQSGTDASAGDGASDGPHSSDGDLQLWAQMLFQRFASMLNRASTHCASVLVRREVARAMSQIASKRMDIFALGRQLHGFEQLQENLSNPAGGESVLNPGSLDETCRDLHMALRRYSHDPHPIVYGYAHALFEKVNDDALLSQVGGDPFGMQSSSSMAFRTDVAAAVSGASGMEEIPSRDSFASGGSVGSAQGLVGSLPRSSNLRPLLPSGGSPVVISLPPAGTGAVRSPPAGGGHVRSGSGNIDLSRLNNLNPRRDFAAAATRPGLGEAQGLHRRHSTGTALRGGVIGAEGGPHASALVNSVGQLIQSVSQTFSANMLGQGGSRRRSGDTAGVVSGSVESDSSGEIFTSTQTGRGLASGLGSSWTGQSAMSGHSRASTRVGLASENHAHRRSYQLLNRLGTSPPRNLGGRLPMPRVGSFALVPGGASSGGIGPAGVRTSSPVSRSEGRSTLVFPGSYADNARSLYDWSVDCVSHLVFETDSPHCMDADSNEVDAGYHEMGYSFSAPDGDDGEEFVWDDGVSDLVRSDLNEQPLKPPSASWTRLVDARKMAAGDGSILAMMFLPLHVGPGRDSLLVTGDSHGRVGIYDTKTGETDGGFGIPGPPGVEESPVTAVICLNKDSSAFVMDQPYESAVILAGAVDGRIAVFKSELTEKKKYSIISTFQASGFADRCIWTARNVLPIGAMAVGQQVTPCELSNPSLMSLAADQATADVRKSGNGLVLSYHSISATLAAGGCQGGTLRTWDLEVENNLRTVDLCGKDDGILTALTMSDKAWDKELIAFGMSNGCVGLFDQRCPQESGNGGSLVYGRHDDPIVSMSVCPRGAMYGPSNQTCAPHETTLLASADVGGYICVWDARVNGREVRRLKAHSSMLTTMAVHPSRGVFVSGSQSRCVKMFNEAHELSGMVTKVTKDGQESRLPPVSALAFGADAKLLAVGCADSTVLLYGKGKSLEFD